MGGCQSKQLSICRYCGKRMQSQQLPNHECRGRMKQRQPISPMKTPSEPLIKPQSQTKPQIPVNNQPNSQSKHVPNPFLPFLKPVFPPEVNPLQSTLYRGQARMIPKQFIDIKVPVDLQRTLFKWTKQPTYYYPIFIKTFRPEIIKTRTFQQKLLWFRLQIQDLRISWQKGCDVLLLDRSKIVTSSLEGLRKINLRKQLKIKFDDEVVDDAGGLLRQWMHLVIKQIFSQKYGLFKQCNTEQTAYKFVWDKATNKSVAKQSLYVLGVVIGKSIFDRISINCYLNRTIIRQICQQTVLMHDVFSFDKQFYKSWNMILDEPGAQQLCMMFSEEKKHSDGSTEMVDLVVNGNQIQVTDKNKYQYIYQIIQLYCVRSVRQLTKIMMEGIYRIVPAELLSVFQPHEFQMLLNGPQSINVKDWRENTLYKGYQYNDQIITWFWTVVQKYDQDKLANLLHYCTGSTRVPILGFKYLQSNRNTINKFMIQKVKFDKNNPYPKSYTCFNRLQLPEYSSLKELQRYLNTVISQQITHFGLG